MNSCDERIEKTLNRAGQTISDLPKATEFSFAHSVNNPEVFGNVMMAACKFTGLNGDAYYFKDFDAVRVLVDYVMHLTDVIDRLETALENVCGERDYLRTMARKEGCRTCIHHTYDNHLLCENEGKLCSLDDRGNCENYEYEGVPEDWSADGDDAKASEDLRLKG